MPLTPEQVKLLLDGELNKARKRFDKPAGITTGYEGPLFEIKNGIRVKRFIRTRTNFPDLPKGGPVKWHDTFSPNKELLCTSRMCKCPTVYTFKGIPYCSPHLIVLLTLELMFKQGVKVDINYKDVGESAVNNKRIIDTAPIAEYPSDRVVTEGLL